eukprot:1150441-Pelagomonas_calceolata.AAC.1
MSALVVLVSCSGVTLFRKGGMTCHADFACSTICDDKCSNDCKAIGTSRCLASELVMFHSHCGRCVPISAALVYMAYGIDKR